MTPPTTQAEPIRYAGCGLDDIWLSDGYVIEWFHGEQTIAIHDLDGLLRAIGATVAAATRPLAGKEIRFLRRQMDMTQAELASLLGCDVQQVARYEKDQNRIPGPADRLLRLLWSDHAREPVTLRPFLAELSGMRPEARGRLVFGLGPQGWRAWCDHAADNQEALAVSG